jgi:IS5 family transposase
VNAKEVPEDRAREVRCPDCAVRRGDACRTLALSRGGRNRTKQRACMGRRRAWLARNEESRAD